MAIWKCTLTYTGRDVARKTCPNFTGDLVGHIAANTEAQARQEAAKDLVETTGINPPPSNPGELIDSLNTPAVIACEKEHV